MSHQRFETQAPNAGFDYEADAAKRRRGWEKRMREFFGRLKHPRVRILVEAYYDVQRLRIAEGNRIATYDRFNMLAPLQSAKLHSAVDELRRIERDIEAQIKDELATINVYVNFLVGVKGIGPVMAGGLIAWIDDAGRFDTVSKLWKYCGLAPGQKRVAGERVGFNPKLKTHLFKVAKQMLQAKNPTYEPVYRQAREEYATRKDILKAHEERAAKSKSKSVKKSLAGYKAHIHFMSMRKMVKLFLSHLWEAWRKLEGLPVRDPYAVEKLGHEKFEPRVGANQIPKETSGERGRG